MILYLIAVYMDISVLICVKI